MTVPKLPKTGHIAIEVAEKPTLGSKFNIEKTPAISIKDSALTRFAEQIAKLQFGKQSDMRITAAEAYQIFAEINALIADNATLYKQVIDLQKKLIEALEKNNETVTIVASGGKFK